MGIVLGLDCTLWLCDAGIGATPNAAVGVEVDNARNVKVPASKGESDVSRRGSGGYKAAAGTMIDAGIDFDMLYVDGDPNFAALLASFTGRTAVGVRAAKGDPDIPGTEVFEADCEVMKFEEDEPLDGHVTYAVTLKPTYSADPPRFFTAS
jgi:hypothetical protein